MNSSQVLTAIANGAVGVSCFVERDPNGQHLLRVNQGTLNGRTIGIGPPYTTASGVSLMYAVSGFEYLTIGSGGCKAGDRLQSDANGNGITPPLGGTKIINVGGFATEDAISGDVILVQVENYTESPGDYLS